MKSRLSSRNAVLRKASLLHEEAERRVAILERRVANETTPIGTMPHEILLWIFQHAVQKESTLPETLMRVCSKWHSLMRSKVAAILWTDCRVNATGPEDLQALNTYLELSRNQKLRLQFNSLSTSRPASLEKSMVFDHISRVESITLHDTNVRTWLPIPPPYSSLRHLRYVGTLCPSLVLTQKAPLLTHAELIAYQEEYPGSAVNFLRKFSTLAPLTHLTLSVPGPAHAMIEPLCAFTGLVYLKWITVHAPSNVPSIEVSLPVLETLVLKGCYAIAALANISAPLVQTLHVYGDPDYYDGWEDGPSQVDEWLSTSPPRFPVLRAVAVPYRVLWEVELLLRGLAQAKHLEELELEFSAESYIRGASDVLECLAGHLAPAPRDPPFPKLSWLRFALLDQPTCNWNPDPVACLADDLKAFITRKEILRPTPGWCQVGLDQYIVTHLDDVATLVQSHPSISVLFGPPPFYITQLPSCDDTLQEREHVARFVRALCCCNCPNLSTYSFCFHA